MSEFTRIAIPFEVGQVSTSPVENITFTSGRPIAIPFEVGQVSTEETGDWKLIDFTRGSQSLLK